MGLFFRKKKLQQNTKKENLDPIINRVEYYKQFIEKTTVEELPKEFKSNNIIFAFDQNKEVFKGEFAVEAAMYEPKLNENGETVYDFLILTGDNAKTLYKNVDRRVFSLRGKGSHYGNYFTLDNLKIEGFGIFDQGETLKQHSVDYCSEILYDLNKNIPYGDPLTDVKVLSLEYLQSLVDLSNRIKTEKPKEEIEEPMEVTTVDELPNKINSSSILFARNEKQSDLIPFHKSQLDAVTYSLRYNENNQPFYDILFLTGDKAKTLYKNVNLNMFKPERRRHPSWSLQLDDKKFEHIFVNEDNKTYSLGQDCLWEKCIRTVGNTTGDITKGRMIDVDKLIDFINKSNEEKLANSESEK